MLMVCLHGAPGVGKLSVGRQLEEKTGYVLVHDHLTIETATSVLPFGSPGFAALRSTLVAVLLDAACKTGRGIVVTHADDVFWKPSFQQILDGCAQRYGYRVDHVFLRCEEGEHVRRITDPERARYQKITDMNRLRRLEAAGEFESPRPGENDLVLDITHSSPANAAEAILASLGLSRKVRLRA